MSFHGLTCVLPAFDTQPKQAGDPGTIYVQTSKTCPNKHFCKQGDEPGTEGTWVMAAALNVTRISGERTRWVYKKDLPLPVKWTPSQGQLRKSLCN